MNSDATLQNGWKKVDLKNLVDSRRSIRYGIVQPGEYDANGRYMIRGQDYSFGWVTPREIFRVSESIELKYKNARVKAGDLLITIVGAGTGTVAIVPEWLSGANLTQTTARIAIDDNQAIPEYCYHYLSSPLGKRLTHLNIKGGAQPGLNCGDIEKYRILLPPLPEQKAIASVLGTVDAALSKTQNLISQKESRMKGLMQQLMTGKMRVSRINGNWHQISLGDVFSERNESDCDQLPLLSVGESGIYPQQEGAKRDISNADKSKYKRICPGDIGYNTMRLWQGRSALSTLEGIVSPAYTIVIPSPAIDVHYFSFLFKLQSVIFSFYRNSQGLVDDTLNCKFHDFSRIKVTVPQSKEEQSAIVSILQKANQEIRLLYSKTEKLREKKRGLMQALLAGKKRIKEFRS